MGAYSSTSRTDFRPDSDDMSKAVVLSALANLDNLERNEAVVDRYYNIGLENIQMAPDFVLAECRQHNNKILFVAFRWQFSIQDMFALEVAGRGEFSKTYGQVAKDLQGLFHNELFHRITCNLPSMSYFQNYRADKIIFSGHSLAGALAHLFLINYMLNTREGTKPHISIAFGSPYFCDTNAKRFCEKTMELSSRMFTIVNSDDPVPWLLTGIRMTVPCNDLDIEDLLSCLDRLNLREMQSKNQSGKPHYASVGLYYEGKELISVNPDMKVANVNSWQSHEVENYVQEFISDTNRRRFPISNMMEIGSKPSIQSCSLSFYHGPSNSEGFIAIRGHDLSQLKDCHVKPDVGDKWRVEGSSDNDIRLRASINKREVYTDQTRMSVQVRTCFGSIEADVQLEDAWNDSYVAYALNRAMGRLLLMKQSEVLAGSEEYKEAYKALKSVFGNRPFDISLETKRNHFEAMKDLLTEKLETPIPNGIVAKLKVALSFFQSTKGLGSQSYVFLSTILRSCPESLCSVIPGESCISRIASESSSYLYCICDNNLGTLNYLAIVRTIYCLLSDTESQNESADVRYYEEKIYEHVQNEGPKVKSRQMLPEGIVTNIEDRAWKMYKIIQACNILEGFRMAVFIGPENTGKTTLTNSILGENVEDVGLTTHTSAATMHSFTEDIFIIDFPGTDAGGERTHLSHVWEDYEKVADLCILVLKFVGDDSRAVKEFPRIIRSRMSKNVVLVMNGVDSILNCPRNSPLWDVYNPQKLRELRLSFAESSGLTINQVFLSVSIANEDLIETTLELLQERGSIIMLKDEITSTLRMLISELK